MSSALQFALTSIQQNDYLTLAVLTAVCYDYALTFSKEIEHIWCKPWSWVSTLFILVRYCGLFTFVATTLSEIIAIVVGWAFLLFIGAADFVMILRVWAMYNRSRLILGILLTLFCLEIIAITLSAAINSDPKNLSAATIQILDFSFCVVAPTSLVWTKMATILQLTHGAAACTLAIAQFVRQSLQMYGVAKQWQLNRYMNLLVKQGILYFTVLLFSSLVSLLSSEGKLPTTGWGFMLLSIMEFVPLYTLLPRFIMSIRELYARDVQGRRGGGIDTGFGLSSFGRGAGETAIVFADVEQNEGSEDVEEIPMEAGTQPK